MGGKPSAIRGALLPSGGKEKSKLNKAPSVFVGITLGACTQSCSPGVRVTPESKTHTRGNLELHLGAVLVFRAEVKGLPNPSPLKLFKEQDPALWKSSDQNTRVFSEGLDTDCSRGGGLTEELREGTKRRRSSVCRFGGEQVLCSPRPAQGNSQRREARKYPPQAGAYVSQHLAHVLGRRHLHGHAAFLSFHDHLQERAGHFLGTSPIPSALIRSTLWDKVKLKHCCEAVLLVLTMKELLQGAGADGFIHSSSERQAYYQRAPQEAEAGESLEPGRRRLPRAKIAPVHSSLAKERDNASNKKKEKNNISWTNGIYPRNERLI
ncbi:hypothetical protein AAY473_006940 [Plecturocebus cupreus]